MIPHGLDHKSRLALDCLPDGHGLAESVLAAAYRRAMLDCEKWILTMRANESRVVGRLIWLASRHLPWSDVLTMVLTISAQDADLSPEQRDWLQKRSQALAGMLTEFVKAIAREEHQRLFDSKPHG